MGAITITPVTKVSVGGGKKCYLCTCSISGTYATGGDTVTFDAGLDLNVIDQVVDLDVQVGTDNQQGVASITSGGLMQYFLGTTGAEVTNGRTLTPYTGEAFLVFGR